MGYTLELWALPVSRLEAELRAPTLDPVALAGDARLPDVVRAAWSGHAAQIAEVVAAGGGEIAGTLSVHVHAVVRLLGTHYGALDHTSGGGDEFRRRFLPGPASDRVGPEVVANLLHRPIAGVTWADYPFLGWVSATEARAAAERARAATDVAPPTPADVAPLRALTRALDLAGGRDLDLVSVYG